MPKAVLQRLPAALLVLLLAAAGASLAAEGPFRQQKGTLSRIDRARGELVVRGQDGGETPYLITKETAFLFQPHLGGPVRVAYVTDREGRRIAVHVGRVKELEH